MEVENVITKCELIDEGVEQLLPDFPLLPCLLNIQSIDNRCFGPFQTFQKPNGLIVFRNSSVISTEGINQSFDLMGSALGTKPWKLGECLCICENGIEMNGRGGPLSSFHLEHVTSSLHNGVYGNNVVRLVNTHSGSCLSCHNGKLIAVPSVENKSKQQASTYFKLVESPDLCQVWNQDTSSQLIDNETSLNEISLTGKGVSSNTVEVSDSVTTTTTATNVTPVTVTPTNEDIDIDLSSCWNVNAIESETMVSLQCRQALAMQGVTHFNDIQRHAFHPIFFGRDVIVTSKEGSVILHT